MHFTKFQKKFLLPVICLPVLIGNFSCVSNSNNVTSSNDTSEEIIPSVKGVAALGQLSPAGEVRKLASPTGQFGTFPRVKNILVKEGDYVSKGTILAIFENRNKLISDLEKNKKLLLTNDQEISLKNKQIKMFEKANANEAYSLVFLLNRKDELLKLKKQKIINLNEKKSLEIDLSNSQLVSPIDGFILSINTREGERSDSSGILEIGASQNMQAIIEVYESDIDRVFINQDVRLTSENGGFDEVLSGNVIRITPQVKQRRVLSTDPTGDADARIIEVLVKLDQKSIDLVKSFSGMKVIAKFIP